MSRKHDEYGLVDRAAGREVKSDCVGGCKTFYT